LGSFKNQVFHLKALKNTLWSALCQRMTQEGGDDWIFDSILGFFKSPEWSTPILDFIDENSVIFDNEEENKLSFTEVHKVMK
jgi:hypothetical protein